MNRRRFARASVAVAVALTAGACGHKNRAATSSIAKVSHTSADRECMARAMYFESHRSADEGMLAVGTVVANRLDSGRYGSSVCDIVGQKRQFAPGVMTRSMDGEAADRARRAAETVLSGKRHPGVRQAMFFHTAGLRFRYPNMHYVLVAGGNAFYEKREAASPQDARDNARTLALALAKARVDPTGPAQPIMVASAAPQQSYVVPTIATAAPGPATIVGTAPAATVKVETTVVAVAATARPAPVPTPAPAQQVAQMPAALAYAVAAPAIVTPAPAPKRVLSPAKLAPAFAASGPVMAGPTAVAEVPTPPPAPAGTVAATPASASPVSAAFSAFETR